MEIRHITKERLTPLIMCPMSGLQEQCIHSCAWWIDENEVCGIVYPGHCAVINIGRSLNAMLCDGLPIRK